MNMTLRTSLLAAAVALSGCATGPSSTASAPLPADRFYTRLKALCGQAFAGRVVTDTPPPTGDDPFAGKDLVMHVRGCGDDELRVPFHVGEDRSRTWVFTRTDSGLRLKHDHRHEDGKEDSVNMYGGDTAEPGAPEKAG